MEINILTSIEKAACERAYKWFSGFRYGKMINVINTYGREQFFSDFPEYLKELHKRKSSHGRKVDTLPKQYEDYKEIVKAYFQMEDRKCKK